jgi:hypothetical protein
MQSMTDLKSRWMSITNRERWAARGSSFVAKAKATREVWFPPKPVETGKDVASTAKKASRGATTKSTGVAKKASTRATKKTTGAAKKPTGAAKKSTGAAKKSTDAAKKTTNGTQQGDQPGTPEEA